MKRPNFAQLWEASRKLFTLVVGSVLSAVGYALFLVPFNIAAGGVSGISIIINHFTGFAGCRFYIGNRTAKVLRKRFIIEQRPKGFAVIDA